MNQEKSSSVGGKTKQKRMRRWTALLLSLCLLTTLVPAAVNAGSENAETWHKKSFLQTELAESDAWQYDMLVDTDFEDGIRPSAMDNGTVDTVDEEHGKALTFSKLIPAIRVSGSAMVYVLEMDLWLSGTSKDFSVCFQSGWSTGPVFNNGDIKAGNRNVGTYVAQKWYRVKVVYDKRTNSYDLAVDGNILAENVSVGTTSLSAFCLNCWSGDISTAVDNLKVYGYYTPANLTVTAVADATGFIGETVTLTANVSGSDTPESVEYFVDGVSVGAVSEAPYSLNWTPSTPGEASIYAVVNTTDGGRAKSDAITVTVNSSRIPNVTFVDLKNAMFYERYALNCMEISATPPNASVAITKVELYTDGTLYGTDEEAPYQFDLTKLPFGSVTLKARAITSEDRSAETECTIILTPQRNATTLVDSDLEKAIPNGVSIAANNGILSYPAYIDEQHGNSILCGPASSAAPHVEFDLTESTDRYLLEYDFYLSEVNVGTSSGFKGVESEGPAFQYGNIMIRENGAFQTVGRVEAKKWYRVAIEINVAENTYSFYLDGKQIGKDMALDSNEGTLLCYRIYCWGKSGSFAVDNIKLRMFDNAPVLHSEAYTIEKNMIYGYLNMTASDIINGADVLHDVTMKLFEADGVTEVPADAPAKKGMKLVLYSPEGNYSCTYELGDAHFSVSEPYITVNGSKWEDHFTDGEVVANVDITNYVNIPVDATVVLALYNAKGLLKAVDTQSGTISAANEKVTFSAGFTVDDSQDTKIKVMVLDRDSLAPIAPAKEMESFSDTQIQDVRFTYPGFLEKAITFSFDDLDYARDPKLIKMFNDAGIKGTFNLMTARIAEYGKENVQKVYSGHEVISHSYSHPRMYLTQPEKINGTLYTPMTLDEVKQDIYQGHEDIKTLTGEYGLGFVWPYQDPKKRSDYNEIMDYIKELGIKYVRPTEATYNFELPTDWYHWETTCHHNAMGYYLDEFLKLDTGGEMKLFSVWGHCYELDPEYTANVHWKEMQEMTEKIGQRTDLWKATNGEVYSYIEAMRGAAVDKDGNTIANSSDETLYVLVNGTKVVIPAHTTFRLGQ